MDNAAKNAPAGTETAVAVFKSAVSASNNALESVQKAVKQATEMAEANFNTVTAQAVSATKATAKGLGEGSLGGLHIQLDQLFHAFEGFLGQAEEGFDVGFLGGNDLFSGQHNSFSCEGLKG